MRIRFSTFFVLASVAVLTTTMLALSPANASPTNRPKRTEAVSSQVDDLQSDRWIVGFTSSDFAALAAADVSESKAINKAFVIADSSGERDALLTKPGATRAELDQLIPAAATPNDPCFTSTCGLASNAYKSYLSDVSAPNAWDISKGSSAVIAIVDGRINTSHPDLAGKLVGTPADFTNGLSVDISSHGTAVASIAAGLTNNGAGTASLGYNAHYRSYIALFDFNGSLVGYSSDIARAIDAAVADHVSVINLSIAGTTANAVLGTSIANAIANGVTVVAAAGNDRSPQLTYPAAYPDVISVGATNATGVIDDSYSNNGSWITMSAPGTSIPAASLGTSYQLFTGTSAASPVVAAAAALLVDQGSEASPRAIANRLKTYANPSRDSYGIVKLNASRSIRTFEAYPGFTGGVSVAAATDANGQLQFVTGAKAGGGPDVKVFNANGQLISEWFAYNPAFQGGVNVAIGDVTGDGINEIVTGAGPGGGPHVIVRNIDGTIMSSFFPYDTGFRGGVNVAVGDIDGDGRDELITGAGAGGGPDVRAYNTEDLSLARAPFYAYGAGFPGGVNVGAADVNGDGRDEILTGAGAGGGPDARAYNAENLSFAVNPFYAYGADFHGGVFVSGGDLNGDSRSEMVTGAGPGGGPHARIFSNTSIIHEAFQFVAANGLPQAGASGATTAVGGSSGRVIYGEASSGSLIQISTLTGES